MWSGRYRPPDPVPGGACAPSPADLEEFRVPLRLFAARRLGNWSAAEDVAQEALRVGLEAIRAERIESTDALGGFLFSTAVNLCMHRGRSASREKRALERLASPAEEPKTGDDPLDALLSSERQACVREALDRLEPDERQLLEMTYRDELSADAIGRRVGATPGTVRVRRHRALRRLAALLGVTTPPVREFKE